jgi:tetratricopeptide (TPR) repeat protein
LSWSYAVEGRYDEALAAKTPLKIEEGYFASRVGRYSAAEKLLAAGKQEAPNAPDQVIHDALAAVLALELRDYARARRHLLTAEQTVAGDANPTRRMRLRVLIHFLNGLAELGAGETPAARARLQLMRAAYRPVVDEERFWYHTLEGEISLADGSLNGASAAFQSAEPARRKPVRWNPGSPSLFASSLPFRDGAARAAAARGDVRGAIQIYRRLLTYDANSKFIAAFEPRYVLAIARLLEKTGDTAGALNEYRRFLDFWKNADPGLAELDEARRAVGRLAR